MTGPYVIDDMYDELEFLSSHSIEDSLPSGIKWAYVGGYYDDPTQQPYADLIVGDSETFVGDKKYSFDGWEGPIDTEMPSDNPLKPGSMWMNMVGPSNFQPHVGMGSRKLYFGDRSTDYVKDEFSITVL
jgi:hypothetical protein